MSGSGTRIASISGLRGVVGDGLDPAVTVEFTAAYAGGCGPGPIVVGHDGRVSASMFSAAVEAGVVATGHDVLLAGPLATPTIGVLVRDLQAAGGIQISASHNPPKYNGLKFFQPAGMVLNQGQGQAMLNRFCEREFHWVSWESLGRGACLTILTPCIWPGYSKSSMPRRFGAGSSRWCWTPATAPGAPGASAIKRVGMSNQGLGR